MNQQDAGRIAFGVVLGVVGAVAITKSGLNPQESILRWLIFALVTGVLVNTQDGKKLPFILTAAEPARAQGLGPTSRRRSVQAWRLLLR